MKTAETSPAAATTEKRVTSAHLDRLEAVRDRLKREHSQLAESGGAFSAHAVELAQQAESLDVAIRTLSIQIAEAAS